MSTDIDDYLRFFDYLRAAIPEALVSVRKNPEGYAVSVSARDKTFSHEFGTTIINDKDARRRCVEKLREGLAGRVSEVAKVGISATGMVLSFTPKLLERAGFTNGDAVELFLGSGADHGWVKVMAAEKSSTRISKGSARFSKRSYNLDTPPIKLHPTEFRVSAGAITVKVS